MLHRSYLLEQMQELGYQPTEEHLDLFELFYQELLIWNAHTNLTRITDEKDFIDKHILDSLSCIKAFGDKLSGDTVKVIDIGTGAGFPVLPLWFFFPEWKICLLDSVKKKLDFITHFVKIATEKYTFLDRRNVQIIHSRAEDLGKDPKYREKFDVVFSRAVSKLPALIELSMPFIKDKGIFIAMKVFEIEEELQETGKILKLTGGEVGEVIKFELLNTGLTRSFVIINKVSKTHKMFPRKAGLAQKQPII